MIIPDLVEHLKRKQEAKTAEQQTEYRTMLMAAVHAEVESLQKSIDANMQANRSAKVNRAKRTLMTIMALLEQVPWVGLDSVNKGQGLEQRVMDTLTEGEEKAQ